MGLTVIAFLLALILFLYGALETYRMWKEREEDRKREVAEEEQREVPWDVSTTRVVGNLWSDDVIRL